jgi:hypothetical protein
MTTDAADLRVWLETEGDGRMLRIAPYVQSATSRDLQYSLLLTRDGVGGRSLVAQRGELGIVPGEPRPISRLSIGVWRQNERCLVEVTLSGGGETLGSYRFDCRSPEAR